jgi:hypothetical protein
MLSSMPSYSAVARSAAAIAANTGSGSIVRQPMARTRTRRRWIAGSHASAFSLASTDARIPETSAAGRRKLSVEKTHKVTVRMPSSTHQSSTSSSLLAPRS